ncbi:MAG: GIY-YIG nuclease family protein [Gemmatimonadaceae bacterium]|nr:GIY-YIG nuclease family protein [Gemmatimonadaceae bacterium]
MDELVSAQEYVRKDALGRAARVEHLSQHYGIAPSLIEEAASASPQWTRKPARDRLQNVAGVLPALLALREDMIWLGALLGFGVPWLIGSLRDLRSAAILSRWASARGTDRGTVSATLTELAILETEATNLLLREQFGREYSGLTSDAATAERLMAATKPAGFVYVVSNPSLPGLVKIGMTTRSIPQRLAELFTTGVPTPFELDAAWPVQDPKMVETKAHEILKAQRKGNDREFFAIDPAVAVSRLAALLGPPPFGRHRTRK